VTASGAGAGTGSRSGPDLQARVTGGGEASDEEVAAIVAAVEVAWPRPAGPAGGPEATQRWRFSGRWWTKPVPLRRSRPW
jgi:hypothetical protein